MPSRRPPSDLALAAVVPSGVVPSDVVRAAQGLYLLCGARGAIEMLALADDLNASGNVPMARLSLDIAEQVRLLDRAGRGGAPH